MEYHAFLCYNSKNKHVVRTIYEYLTNSALKVFFDEAAIAAGDNFQQKLEAGLRGSASILVVVGPDGVGPWQEEENHAYKLLTMVPNNKRVVIPVVLPGAAFGPNEDGVPLFLNNLSAFRFETSAENKDDLFRLMRAIPRCVEALGPLERPFLREEQDRLHERTIEFYDKEARLYYERWKTTLPLPAMHAFLSEVKQVTERPRILDAGCGPGHHSVWFAEQGCEVEGLDVSPSMIRIAEANKVTHTNYRIADMRDLQRAYGARNIFDGIWACASCFHITKEAFGNQMYEFLAVMKPSGVLALSMQVGVPSSIQSDGRFFERYEESELRDRVSRYGFHIVNESTQISDRNTRGLKQIKKWMNITALAPKAKDRIDILEGMPKLG